VIVVLPVTLFDSAVFVETPAASAVARLKWLIGTTA